MITIHIQHTAFSLQISSSHTMKGASAVQRHLFRCKWQVSQPFSATCQFVLLARPPGSAVFRSGRPANSKARRRQIDLCVRDATFNIICGFIIVAATPIAPFKIYLDPAGRCYRYQVYPGPAGQQDHSRHYIPYPRPATATNRASASFLH